MILGVVLPEDFFEYRGLPFLISTWGGSTFKLESLSPWRYGAVDPWRRSIEGIGEPFLINDPASPLLVCGVGISDGPASLKSLFISSRRTPQVSG